MNILIIYDYFYPAYKAGGIIQSLKNLIHFFDENYNFTIVTSAYDLNEKKILDTIIPDKIIKFSENSNVIYFSKKRYTYLKIYQIVKSQKDQIIYFNGIYSIKFFLYPLIILKIINSNVKIIIAPRGMLQTGALEVKSFKKGIYLNTVKFLGLTKNITWHATDEQERLDIKSKFEIDSTLILDKVIIAPDTPISTNTNTNNYFPIIKRTNEVKFVTISLVTEKKNHKFFIDALLHVNPNFNIIYDIYGPIKDKYYWKDCLNSIEVLPKNIVVNYKGSIKPEEVSDTLNMYHFFVLPTKGENFGHAIFEAFMNSRPVILSNKTLWSNTEKFKAGWLFDLDHKEASNELIKIIHLCCQMNQLQYDMYSKNANLLAKNFINDLELDLYYSKLFTRKN